MRKDKTKIPTTMKKKRMNRRKKRTDKKKSKGISHLKKEQLQTLQLKVLLLIEKPLLQSMKLKPDLYLKLNPKILIQRSMNDHQTNQPLKLLK